MDGRIRHAFIHAARRAATLAALALTIAPAAALANTPPAVLFGPGTQAEAVARQIARDTWGGEPCGGTVTVSWTQLGPQVNASSTWTNPTDAYANPSQNYDCLIQFNTVADFDWPMFCAVMAHEYGHLWGQRHSADEHSLMSAYYTDPLPACSAVPDPTAPPASSSLSLATAQSRTAARTKQLHRSSRAGLRKAKSRHAVARARARARVVVKSKSKATAKRR